MGYWMKNADIVNCMVLNVSVKAYNRLIPTSLPFLEA